MTNTFKLNKELIESLPSNLDNKVNLDLSNSSYLTNRVVKTPKGVEIQLTSEAIIYKKDSIVYVPNGFESDGITPHYDKITLSQDFSGVFGSASTGARGTVLACIRPSDGNIQWYPNDHYFVSATVPTFSDGWGLWWDTTNNVIKLYNNNSYITQGFSLPTHTQTENYGIKSIDQIFNSFGYIDTVVFMLPGINVEYSIGRNSDGTFINKSYLSTDILTFTPSSGVSGWFEVGFDINSSTDQIAYFGEYSNKQYISSTKPSLTNVHWYNPITGQNRYVDFNGIVSSQLSGCFQLCRCQLNSNRVISWINHDSCIHQVNTYSRTDLTNIPMPSKNYIDLSIGATETAYQAPDNGYFIAVSNAATGETWLALYNTTTMMGTFVNAPSGWDYQRVLIPVSRGDTVKLAYGNVGIRFLRFVFANGSL